MRLSETSTEELWHLLDYQQRAALGLPRRANEADRMIPKVFPNPAHQRAYENGVMAARNGKERFPPYSIDSNSSRYFRRAWLAGYDGAAERMSSNDQVQP